MDPGKTIGVDYLKLENFDGSNFNAWRRKVIFGMQFLKLYYVISEEKLNFKENSKDEISYEGDDHFCKSYLLNCLTDHLAEVYSNKPYARDIWNALEDQ